VYSSLSETHSKTTEQHLLYRIAECYLPHDTGERTRFTYPRGMGG